MKNILHPAGKYDNYFASWNDFQIYSFKQSSNADWALATVLVVYN